MKKIIFNGEPGERWTNDGPRVMFQFVAELRNTCGACLSYHMAISTFWPIPIHRRCRCSQRPVRPGQTAEPWVDFRAILDGMDDSQKRAAVGSSLYRLIKRGVVEWSDAVTGSRVRTLREVVARGKLTVDAMVKAGVREPIAQHAWQAVNTPELAVVKAHRKSLVQALEGAGVKRDKLIEAAAEKLADRIVVQGIDLGGAGAKITPPKIGPDDLVRILGLDATKAKAAFKPKAKAKPKPKVEPREAKPEPKTEPTRLPIETTGTATAREAEDLADMVARTLPEPVNVKLKESGVVFVLAEKITDAVPEEHRNAPPRGWEAGSTWDNINGIYVAGEKKAVVAKTYVDRLTGKKRDTGSANFIALHEVGHAVDHVYNYPSTQKGFREAYTADVAAIKGEDHGGSLDYYLQPGDAGPSETFAELTAFVFRPTSMVADIRDWFPKTTAWLEKFYGVDKP